MKLTLRRIMEARSAVMVACMGMVFIPHLSAQSADIFQSLDDTTQNAVGGDLTKSPMCIELLKSSPSRFAIDNIKLYIVAQIEDLSMKDRATDPFGLFQDAELKPNPERPTTNTPGGDKIPIALQDIVNQIEVSTIMVREKCFRSQDQVLKESMEFTIGAGDRTKRLKVLKVEETKIVFQDLDSEEEATLLIRQALPPGLFLGGDRLPPDGMASPAKNPHIHMEFK